MVVVYSGKGNFTFTSFELHRSMHSLFRAISPLGDSVAPQTLVLLTQQTSKQVKTVGAWGPYQNPLTPADTKHAE
jgi:hypothetical protein